MEKLYYLNHQKFQEGDLKNAFSFALNLCAQDHNIDTITLLVPQANHYDIIGKELGIPPKDCTKHIIPNRLNMCLQVHTVRTYHPDYQLVGRDNCELLLAIWVNPKELNQFLDKSKVKYWVIVPWLLNDNKSFLEIHRAVDMETGKALHVDYQMDERVKRAIEWLKSTSYPNDLFHHPFDEERLKKMSNALSHYKIPFSHDALVNYCINNGIVNDAAQMIAEYFTKAQKRKFSMRDPGYHYMKQIMDGEK